MAKLNLNKLDIEDLEDTFYENQRNSKKKQVMKFKDPYRKAKGKKPKKHRDFSKKSLKFKDDDDE
tara:strand:- start:2664 stop:2858 length:195 start_codon:yes stop_codon:yes gene_type:complete